MQSLVSITSKRFKISEKGLLSTNNFFKIVSKSFSQERKDDYIFNFTKSFLISFISFNYNEAISIGKLATTVPSI
jgi:hypothetical protein